MSPPVLWAEPVLPWFLGCQQPPRKWRQGALLSSSLPCCSSPHSMALYPLVSTPPQNKHSNLFMSFITNDQEGKLGVQKANMRKLPRSFNQGPIPTSTSESEISCLRIWRKVGIDWPTRFHSGANLPQLVNLEVFQLPGGP